MTIKESHYLVAAKWFFFWQEMKKGCTYDLALIKLVCLKKAKSYFCAYCYLWRKQKIECKHCSLYANTNKSCFEKRSLFSKVHLNDSVRAAKKIYLIAKKEYKELSK